MCAVRVTPHYFINHVKQPAAFMATPALLLSTSSQSSSANPYINNIVTTKSLQQQVHERMSLSKDCSDYAALESAVQKLLMHNEPSYTQGGLTEELLRGLIEQPNNVDNTQYPINDNHGVLEEGSSLHEKLRGMPERPFSREIIRRLATIQNHCNHLDSTQDELGENNIMFLPANHFGLTEITPMDSLLPHPYCNDVDLSSVEDCMKWLRRVGERGIFALLGLRRTVGTAFIPSSDEFTANSYLFPPTLAQLITASCELHRPNSKSSLTVGARALAKHADRGQSGYYGVIYGNESVRNNHAKNIVTNLIKHASWINIHNFGGMTEVGRPVIEVRTMEGYGARWSAVWTKNMFTPEEITFRGFLEPQMEDGHEKRWRH